MRLGHSPAPEPGGGSTQADCGQRANRRLQPGELERLRASLAMCRSRLIPHPVSSAIETGMCRSELLNARWTDLSVESRTLHIPVTKDGEPRTIPLASAAIGIIDAVIASGLHVSWPGSG